MPTKRQWRAWGAVLTFKEKLIITFLLFIIISISGGWSLIYYLQNTKVVSAFGGEHKEAIVSSISSINPLLAQTDADRDLVNLIFSGLMKYNYNRDGQLIGDLAESYETLDSGKTYLFHLREAYWHDGERITADDVVFTIQTVQNPDYKSPERINWRGVKVEKVDDLTIKFSLEESYAPFLENTTFGILPKHIFQEIPIRNFALAEVNLKPVGSGPYKYKNSKINKDGSIQSYTLEANLNYHHPPLIKFITFLFFNNQKEALEAFKKNKVQGVNFILAKDKNSFENSIKRLNLPTYFAVFFNQNKNKALADKNVRSALALTVNREEMIQKIMQGKAALVNSPVFSFQIGYTQDLKVYNFSPEEAVTILEKNKISNLEISLLTSNWPELVQAAELLKENWEKIGVKVNLEIKQANEFQDFIRSRDYQALLIGINLRLDPDPFTFWHSSQKRDPGLNFALYDNQNADKLLSEARQNINPGERAKKYQEFQKILIDDLPAIFLFSPNYLYLLSSRVKGFDLQSITLPSKRFLQVNEWYVKTKRIFK